MDAGACHKENGLKRMLFPQYSCDRRSARGNDRRVSALRDTMPKPVNNLLTWINALDPPEELAARMALARINPWCRQDPHWVKRIDHLRADLIKTDADRDRFARQSRKMAHDIKNARRLMKAAPASILVR